MGLGQLIKMQITGYKDNTFSTKLSVSPNPYEVLINPESYSLTYGTESSPTSAQGASEATSTTNKRIPQSLTFKFLFDGTGVIKKSDGGILSGLASGLAVPGLSGSPPDVAQDLANFKAVVYDYQSDTHQPPFVQLNWGVLLYNCKLTRMTVNFKLFKPDGSPLRAEADCTFEEVIDQAKLTAIENKQSPDLTHIRTVIAGDTLPLMCYREYGDSKYYYQVAKVNGITDFKKLTPGMKLAFPPIKNN